jgi:two-component system NtrC family sensor kinase
MLHRASTAMNDSKRILLVEDSPSQAARTTALLEQEAFAVTHAASAEEALSVLSSLRPDLLIVDYDLPGMRGDDFCRRIRLDPSLATVPVLILTATDEVEAERVGLDSGADDYMAKSTDPAILALRIKSLLQRGAQLDRGLSRAARSTPRSLRCLVVDDSATQRFLIESLLAEEGYEVLAVATPGEALAALERENFDCVVGDLVMPDIDGIELCRRVDALRRRRDLFLPIIIHTARERSDDMLATLQAGADDFLVKSSDLTPLKTRLRVLLRRKTQFDEATRIDDELRRKDERIRLAEERAALVTELETAYRRLQETQAQLVQTAKMASLGELVAGIAHEINNPLAFVLSHLGTVEERIAGAAEQLGGSAPAGLRKAASRLADMHEGLNRIRDLVAKLRTFSRLDEGKLKTVNIHESLDSTLRILNHRLTDKIVVDRKYCTQGDLSCFADEINQVFMNVIANSIDAVEGSGTITISTDRDDTNFRIVVSDSGNGIPLELRDRVFEPFFTTKDVGKGTGLGLSISYSIVRRHGGTIELGDNPHGSGAAVTITVPVRMAAPGGEMREGA